MLIGELSERTGVSARLLRYYESQGLLTPIRTPNGYRDYDEASVLTVHQIRALLDAGLTTDTIGALLPCAHGAPPRLDLCIDVQALLTHELDATDTRMADLRRSREALAAWLGAGSSV
ncbi:MerR family transcriptional regulator [Streptomyces yaizuensis]|uniref:MerR family transcriptional regulator n=1 Tax=Streptomyces yaizuensis TaxID=2989713 RepID=A0ABQ5NZ67_9ACTN|nr:MerR family transcriptional regulator [Streptomyces sp. YSPA8]GLF95453.1 MerR family transcriptional regulator [Streptomyces sp. YSPA8]